ncbi:MAG: radical SAM protein [Alphaproteobacteria bacterium]|nr:radical SAM protein [Alphaproteobacteria bacterium]
MNVAVSHPDLKTEPDGQPPLDPRKFVDRDRTAGGEPRAQVDFAGLETLWFNTGTQCNLTCRNCYIESSPTNDRLVYLMADEVHAYLEEIRDNRWQVPEIGFTGGEPFLNPQFIAMARRALEYGHRVLVLTNAMRPMMVRSDALMELRERHGDRLILRVSLDHYSRQVHEAERGPRSWDPAIAGLNWLSANGFRVRVAGRTFTEEGETRIRQGFARLFAAHGIGIDADDPIELVLFPEMDEHADVPEITTACWQRLDIDPRTVMCASSRMVVKRRGSDRSVITPCTLIPYDTRFDLGERLREAAGPVKLNHPHCARFCVLGGGSCSVSEGAA